LAGILFAWELGANLGHLTRDLPLARACRDGGHQVVVAASNLRTVVKLMGQEGFTLVQAPILKSNIQRNTSPVCYPDMLLHEGYDDVDALNAAVTGWEGLIDLIRPSALVYNHAPTALIAARIKNLPALMVGTGFEIPLASSSQPSFRPWQGIPQSVFVEAEKLVTSHINRLLSLRGSNVLERFADLFFAPATYLATFPELDPFGPRGNVTYIGPLFALADVPVVDWQGPKTKRRIFAYLRPAMAACEQILRVLQDVDAEVICAIPGAPPDWLHRFPTLRIVEHAIHLERILPSADVVITYGATTIATALLAGVPVLLVPQVVEQFLAGIPLEKTGAGLMLRDPRSMDQLTILLQNLLNIPSYRQAASAFALRHAKFNGQQACRKLMDAVELAMDSSKEK